MMKKIFLLFICLTGALIYAQNKESAVKAVTPPLLVKTSFENEFKNSTASWTSDYEGYDSDEERYIATFNSADYKCSAYYDTKGTLKVLEQLIKIDQVPSPILNYLKENFPTYKVNEAVKITNDKKIITYELGISNNERFFIAQFDNTGYFLQINENK